MNIISPRLRMFFPRQTLGDQIIDVENGVAGRCMNNDHGLTIMIDQPSLFNRQQSGWCGYEDR